MLTKLTLDYGLNTTRRGLIYSINIEQLCNRTLKYNIPKPLNPRLHGERTMDPFGQRQVMVTHVLLCSDWSLVRISIPWDRAHPRSTLLVGPSLSNPKTTYGTSPGSIYTFRRCGKGLCNKFVKGIIGSLCLFCFR